MKKEKERMEGDVVRIFPIIILKNYKIKNNNNKDNFEFPPYSVKLSF